MKSRRRLKPGLKLALGFMLIITVGAVILYSPLSRQSGAELSFLDAFFVSTSAVCVTGLTPVDISKTLSDFGSFVMMLLIQIGGLGYASLAVLIISLTGNRVNKASANLLRDSLGADQKIDARQLLKLAISVTAIIELSGAFLLFLEFRKHFSIPRAMYYSLFHSVSAFNNAGFDLFSDSMMKWNENALVIITIASLIIFGGLGFLLYGDLLDHIKKKKKLSLHTKIVLSTTAFLIIVGTILFKICLKDISLLNAFFQSVTTRTAGYFSYDQSTLTQAGVLLTIVLMFIGASPGSTGGGVKTTSFFTAVKASFYLLLGRNATAFKREISQDSVMKAFFAIILSVLIIAFAVFLLTLTDPAFPLDMIVYEAVSAYATVGLTMGITPDVSSLGKIILIVLMFLGRVGFMTIITAFAKKSINSARYLEEKVIIG